eukprot:2003959-Amphidinium_carterae.1
MSSNFSTVSSSMRSQSCGSQFSCDKLHHQAPDYLAVQAHSHTGSPKSILNLRPSSSHLLSSKPLHHSSKSDPIPLHGLNSFAQYLNPSPQSQLSQYVLFCMSTTSKQPQDHDSHHHRSIFWSATAQAQTQE